MIKKFGNIPMGTKDKKVVILPGMFSRFIG